MRDNEFTKILNWPGYRVFRHEIDETAMTLRLWVRRKRGNRKLICSGCGRKFTEAHDYYQREVRDLPWRKYQTAVIIELYRVLSRVQDKDREGFATAGQSTVQQRL